MVEKNLKVKQKEPIDLIARPFHKFAQIEASGGILLVICALIALIWANSPWRDVYHKLWKVHLTFSFGPIHLSYELLHWINDGLMVIFFFVVGMEIKREFVEGELSTRKHAMLPVAGAMGGMLRSYGILERLQQSSQELHAGIRAGEQQSAVRALKETCDEVEAPLRRFIQILHRWVIFGILAGVCAGKCRVTLDQTLLSSLLQPLGLGILLALVLGKQGGSPSFVGSL